MADQSSVDIEITTMTKTIQRRAESSEEESNDGFKTKFGPFLDTSNAVDVRQEFSGKKIKSLSNVVMLHPAFIKDVILEQATDAQYLSTNWTKD